jgi:hypothetical protein
VVHKARADISKFPLPIGFFPVLGPPPPPPVLPNIQFCYFLPTPFTCVPSTVFKLTQMSLFSMLRKCFQSTIHSAFFGQYSNNKNTFMGVYKDHEGLCKLIHVQFLKVRSRQIRSAWEWYHLIGLKRVQTELFSNIQFES